jgi:glucosamine--fructose-6-phosphate aminotransferase (isomerizing)
MLHSIMAKEARQSPTVLRAEAARWQEQARAIRQQTADRSTAVLVGRGSSGNVCSYAAYLLALHSGRQPIEFRPWLATQTLPPADWRDAVVYAFSYSGRSTDIAASAEWLRARGATVVAVTEAPSPDAELLKIAQHVIRLGCGAELAVPATKSVVAQLFIAAALAGNAITEAAAQTAECMERIDAAGTPAQLATFLEGARTVTWLARGPSIGGALDAALKMQESAGIPATGYSMAEYLHGPIAAASAADRVVLFSGADEPMESKQAVASALLARGVPFVCMGDDRSPEANLPLPFPDARWARTSILATIAQLTCAELAERQGINPDAHPSLLKVTRTL